MCLFALAGSDPAVLTSTRLTESSRFLANLGIIPGAQQFLAWEHIDGN